MPGGDRTGPVGMGPLTGRGAGFCAGSGVPGSMNPASGAGGAFFGGRGGRGRRNRFLATGLCGWQRAGMAAGARGYGATFFGTDGTSPAEREGLERQVREMEGSLKAIRTRLDALAAGEKAE